MRGLPTTVADALRSISDASIADPHARKAYAAALEAVGTLDPRQVGWRSRQIGTAAGLYPIYRDQPRKTAFDTPKTLLLRHWIGRDFDLIEMFHGDGYRRAAALARIDGALPTPFMVAALIWRLNDWAPPVRAAAVRCMRHTLPMTALGMVAAAMHALMPVMASWRRWDRERSALDAAMALPEVCARLADLIAVAPTGPGATILGHALRWQGMEAAIGMLARSAVQPSVRAVAIRSLLTAEARWPDGRERVWVDKSLGKYSTKPRYARRVLKTAQPQAAVIALALADRSAAVRRLGLDEVSRVFGRSAEARNLALPLAHDRAASVRMQARVHPARGPRAGLRRALSASSRSGGAAHRPARCRSSASYGPRRP